MRTTLALFILGFSLSAVANCWNTPSAKVSSETIKHVVNRSPAGWMSRPQT